VKFRVWHPLAGELPEDGVVIDAIQRRTAATIWADIKQHQQGGEAVESGTEVLVAPEDNLHDSAWFVLDASCHVTYTAREVRLDGQGNHDRA
jgi:hypothetical protein